MAKTYMQKVLNEIIDSIKRNDNIWLGGNAYYYFAVSNDENLVIDESTFDFYTKEQILQYLKYIKNKIQYISYYDGQIYEYYYINNVIVTYGKKNEFEIKLVEWI